MTRRKIKLRKKSVLKKLSKKQFMLMKIRSSNQNKTKRILIMMRMSKTLFQMKSLRKSKLKRQNLPLKRHRQLAQLHQLQSHKLKERTSRPLKRKGL